MSMSDTEKKVTEVTTLTVATSVPEPEADPYAHLALCSDAFKRFPPDIVEGIVAMLAQGAGSGKIAGYLTEKGHVYSPRMVREWIKKEQTARNDLIEKTAIEREIGKYQFAPEVAQGLAMYDEELKLLNHKRKEHLLKKDHKMFLEFSDQILKVSIQRMKVFENAEKRVVKDDVAVIQARILEKLADATNKIISTVAPKRQEADQPVIDVTFTPDDSV